jgi:hypothetical protein
MRQERRIFMKVYLEFGGGGSDTIFIVNERYLVDYENKRELLHERFGGRATYTSRSGLSGSGFLEFSPEDPYVLFGYYRTDINHNQQCRRIVGYTRDGQPIFGYAPIAGHGGIDKAFPVVLTDGERVAFVDKFEILEKIRDFDSLEFKAIELQSFRWADGSPTEETIGLHIGVRYCRLPSAVRFTLFGHELVSSRETSVDPGRLSRVHDMVGITMSWDGKRFLLVSRDGIPVKCWDKDPLSQPGEEIAGYKVVRPFVVARYYPGNNKIFVAGCYPATELSADVPGEIRNRYFDYEIEMPVLEWAEKTPLEWDAFLRSKAAEKLKNDLKFLLKEEEEMELCLKLLHKNPEILFRKQDSVDAGNCVYGTEKFLATFKLPEELSAKELSQHPQLKRMLREKNFRRVILWKFA